ncbi:leukemia inhibitory factor [Podarcis raffonei]|uniref:leukemia inhibitory factor n=1 Tax=Podarcis raffonei TaxID=65483 RepID=UPI00232976F4|nr:leukemia inhibitory factor [Podarcis raffonei]
MQFTMKAIISGVVPLLLAIHCRLVPGKPLLRNRRNLMCDNIGPCGETVFNQIKCQVTRLNLSAPGLFDAYLESQGSPFNRAEVKSLCVSKDTFPSFDNRTRKEMLISLYKIFTFFNASLGNITRDQENNDRKDLLERLSNTTAKTRGLLANLTCLLCSEYKVTDVKVTYGSEETGAFEKKKQGCWALRMYAETIPLIAQALGKCHRQR